MDLKIKTTYILEAWLSDEWLNEAAHVAVSDDLEKLEQLKTYLENEGYVNIPGYPETDYVCTNAFHIYEITQI